MMNAARFVSLLALLILCTAVVVDATTTPSKQPQPHHHHHHPIKRHVVSKSTYHTDRGIFVDSSAPSYAGAGTSHLDMSKRWVAKMGNEQNARYLTDADVYANASALLLKALGELLEGCHTFAGVFTHGNCLILKLQPQADTDS